MDDTEPPAETVRAVYDAVAAEYADRFADELNGKPLDRALLEQGRSAGRGGLIGRETRVWIRRYPR